MIQLKGQYNTAKVFADVVDAAAIAQIQALLNQPFIAGSKIRIMPDVHAGMGCTIGTTMTIRERVVPNLVGVDIGCGMETVRLNDSHAELAKLDRVIHEHIPAGFNIRQEAHPLADEAELSKLRCLKQINRNRAELSIGTLGGGNHFIELGRDDAGALHLVVHSGSRNLGTQVAETYQGAAACVLKERAKEIAERIDLLMRQGKTAEAEAEKRRHREVRTEYDLAYVDGALFEDYLHDMALVQRYAALNREAIARTIIKQMKFKVDEVFTTIHNYIDLDSMILRKGAISAREGERVLIPINMRDGSLLCTGKGNPDWNESAPHGAGRLMSRSAAKEQITLSAFQKSMVGIYSSTVNRGTLDEAPFAYKPMEELLENIRDTVTVNGRILPLYNFKAA